MDLGAYLERIGYTGDARPDLGTLQAMHHAHFLNVPFENLDIQRGVRIEVDESVNFDKLVTQGRGGFCLELSGMFARALRQIGFYVDVIGARVFSEGNLSYPMSHMTLIVHLDDEWIADVGFGGRIAGPLRLNQRGEQVFGIRRYVVENDGDHWFVTCLEDGHDTATYTFTLQPREFSEFEEVCNWLQTSPDSRFTLGDVITLPSETGRVTLAGEHLVTSSNGGREERNVTPVEAAEITRGHFKIDLPERNQNE